MCGIASVNSSHEVHAFVVAIYSYFYKWNSFLSHCIAVDPFEGGEKLDACKNLNFCKQYYYKVSDADGNATRVNKIPRFGLLSVE